MNRILVIGAAGQLGTELTLKLREKYGHSKIVTADIKDPTQVDDPDNYVRIDACNARDLSEIVSTYDIDQVYHLAAILSAKGELNPISAWDLNMTSLLNVLELGREGRIKKIYWPSSIAVFGPGTPSTNTPQDTIMDPDTVYGISKLAGERWCEYYFNKFGVDVRSLRYPGLIGYKSMPGGGTTDYAVDIFYKAAQEGSFECFLKPDTALPMMYMDDAVRATLELMEAPPERVSIRSSYNIGAMTFTPSELFEEVRTHFFSLKISYKPDFRQKIADTWPNSIDDSMARNDWQWKPEYDLSAMTGEMVSNLSHLVVNNKS